MTESVFMRGELMKLGVLAEAVMKECVKNEISVLQELCRKGRIADIPL